MFRNYELISALVLLVCGIIFEGFAKKIVIHSFECSAKSKIVAKVVCQRDPPLSVNITLTTAEEEASDVFGSVDLKVYPRGYRRSMDLKFKWNLCNLTRQSEQRSLLGETYRDLLRAAVNFPKKCPFERNTTISLLGLQFSPLSIPHYYPEANFTFMARFYANRKLAFTANAGGAFCDNGIVKRPSFMPSTPGGSCEVKINDTTQPAKQVVFESVKCTLKTKIIPIVTCKIESPLALTVNATIGDKEPVNTLLAVIDLQVFTEDAKNALRLKNIRVELCDLKRILKKQSWMAIYYRTLRRSAANFPEKCPFLMNTTYTLKRIQFDGNDMPQYMPDFNYTLYAKFYANKKLSIEMNANGGFYQVYRRFK